MKRRVWTTDEAIGDVEVALAAMPTFAYGGLNAGNIGQLVRAAREHQRMVRDLKMYNALFMSWIEEGKPQPRRKKK